MRSDRAPSHRDALPIACDDRKAGEETALSRGPNLLIPRGGRRYLRVNYTVGTGPLTAGTFWAGLVKDVQDTATYASGFVIA